jgi:hypothetical protein
MMTIEHASHPLSMPSGLFWLSFDVLLAKREGVSSIANISRLQLVQLLFQLFNFVLQLIVLTDQLRNLL